MNIKPKAYYYGLITSSIVGALLTAAVTLMLTQSFGVYGWFGLAAFPLYMLIYIKDLKGALLLTIDLIKKTQTTELCVFAGSEKKIANEIERAPKWQGKKDGPSTQAMFAYEFAPLNNLEKKVMLFVLCTESENMRYFVNPIKKNPNKRFRITYFAKSRYIVTVKDS